MTTVTVRASQTYDVKVGRGLLATLGQEAAALFPTDIDGYISHKAPFIEGIYAAIAQEDGAS